jgi:hypothetical protein
VCIAASNAGDTSQDLKTGYLIGATPWKQQVALMFGVVISTFIIGWTLNAMNKGLESFQRVPSAKVFALNALPDGVSNQGNFTRDHVQLTIKSPGGGTSHQELTHARQYILLNSIGSSTLEDGKYLYNPATGQIEVQWVQGIGSEKAAAPQGRLMATVINGILTRKLPWSLVMLGVALVIGIELLGVRSLTFAVGAYLSIATTLAIFCGGVIRWLVDEALARSRGGVTELNEEVSPGSLYASGLIAAGGIMGLLGVCVKLYEGYTEKTIPRFAETNFLHRDWVSVVMFALLAYSLYYFARRPIPSEAMLEEVEHKE